ncbi:MAG: tRNA pseudouridine(38-40) synthase TruA [Acidobacteriota bacterium]
MAERRDFRITLAYDGTDYEGWQLQPNSPTIQGEVEASLARIAGRRIVLTGASRTDSGVHARGQVASFTWDHPLPADRIPMALNAGLRPDIRVLECVEAPGFDARRDCVSKTYSYTICNARVADPFTRRYAAHVPRRLDIEPMRAAAGLLTGEIDLSAFAPVETVRELGARGGVRTISLAQWDLDGGHLVFRISGSGFLRYSIRTMVGAMVEIGRGSLALSDLESAILSRSRPALKSATMPAHGLCLCQVRY